MRESHFKLIVPALFVSALAAFMTACLPDPLEVHGVPVVQPRIVVNSQIVPDESLVILLTKSFGALEASDDSDPTALLEQIAVDDALVTVSHENVTDTLLNLGSGLYGGIQIELVPGTQYTLNAVSASLGAISASTEVKTQIQFSELSGNLYFDNFDDTLAEVTYVLRDPPGDNWYMISALKLERDDLQENLLNPRDFVRLHSDAAFEGETFSEVFRIFPREFRPGDTLAVYLSNISEEYYNFMKLRLDNRFSLVEFISEPVNYPTNVEGGLGFFNLYLPDVRLMVLEEE